MNQSTLESSPGDDAAHAPPSNSARTGLPGARQDGIDAPPPRELTTFVGRTEELQLLTERVKAGSPLLTIVGPPGFGKTRLGLRLLHQTRESGRPVFFCDLRSVATAEDLAAQLLRTLDASLSATSEAADRIDAVSRVLRAHGSCVVMLDNFEQLVDTGARLVHEWLQAAPDLQFLVTSRRLLRVEGEWPLELGPLPLPTHDDDWSAPAMQLLLDRARTWEPRFDRSSDQVRHAARLARRLGGVPLSLEIAAAQLRRTGWDHLLSELDHTLDLAITGTGVFDPRHSSLRTAMESSWTLLDAWEQRALARLSVFRSQFSTEAAEEVIELGGLETAPGAAETLARLREASLLQLATEVPRRWEMYEAVREFAREHLESKEAATAASRHARHFLREGESRVRALSERNGFEAHAWLERENENLEAALTWWVESPNGQRGNALRMALVVAAGWIRRMPIQAVDALTRALDVATRDSLKLRHRGLVARAEAFYLVGRYNHAEADLGEARRLAIQDGAATVDAERIAGLIALDRGDPELARDHLRCALLHIESSAPRHLEPRIRAVLARVRAEAFRDPGALRQYDEALQALDANEEEVAAAETRLERTIYAVNFREGTPEHLLRTLRQSNGKHLSRFHRVHTLTASGLVHLDRNKLESARRCFHEARMIAQRAGERYIEACATLHEAMAWEAQDHALEADTCYRAALRVAQSLENKRLEGIVCLHQGGFLAQTGSLDGARDSLARADRLFRDTGERWFPKLVPLQYLRIAVAERAADSPEPDASSRPIDEQIHQAIEKARHPHTEEGITSLPLVSGCPEARFIVRRLEGSLQPLPDECTRLTVRRNGTTFRLDGKTADFAPNSVIASVLHALLEARLEDPGRALSTSTLIRRAWPDQRLQKGSGSKRLRNVVVRLRKAGLRGTLLRNKAGYYLDPDIPVALDPGDDVLPT